MVDLEALKAALEAVLDDLARHDKSGASGKDEANAAGTGTNGAEDYLQTLQRLSEQLTGGMDEAGEALSAHPFIAVSAAFMLGVAVGRLSRG